jgi:hypothetical protein
VSALLHGQGERNELLIAPRAGCDQNELPTAAGPVGHRGPGRASGEKLVPDFSPCVPVEREECLLATSNADEPLPWSRWIPEFLMCRDAPAASRSARQGASGAPHRRNRKNPPNLFTTIHVDRHEKRVRRFVERDPVHEGRSPAHELISHPIVVVEPARGFLFVAGSYFSNRSIPRALDVLT